MANETLTEVFSDIADAIRAKGVSGQMKPTEMSTKITSIPSGGGSKYGVSGDNILGDVNAQGVLQSPNQTFAFSTSEIRRIPMGRLYQFFYKFPQKNLLTEINLPNLEVVESDSSSTGQVHGGMAQCCCNCTGLTSVSMPQLSSLGNVNSTAGNAGAFSNCFEGCSSLSSVNMSSLQDIAPGGMQECFIGCTSLINVNLQSLKTLSGSPGIGALTGCFKRCTSLQTINLSGTKTYIGDSAFTSCFFNCTSLRVVDMSNWGTPYVYGGGGAFDWTFYGCTSLEVVNFDGIQSVPSIATNTFQNTNSTFKVVVPDELYDTWIAATNWSAYASQIVKASEYTPAN